MRQKSRTNEEIRLRDEVFDCGCSLKKCEGLEGPPTFLEGGNLSAKTWVIGINPKQSLERTKEYRDVDSSEKVRQHEKKYFFKNPYKDYYGGFVGVLEKDWLSVLVQFRTEVCHTDLVKCASEGDNNYVRKAISNCSGYLSRQIELFKPKLLICNGTIACDYFKKTQDFIKKKAEATSGEYETKDGKHRFTVIYSGFVGRDDSYSRLRLGNEVDEKRRILKA